MTVLVPTVSYRLFLNSPSERFGGKRDQQLCIRLDCGRQATERGEVSVSRIPGELIPNQFILISPNDVAAKRLPLSTEPQRFLKRSPGFPAHDDRESRHIVHENRFVTDHRTDEGCRSTTPPTSEFNAEAVSAPFRTTIRNKRYCRNDSHEKSDIRLSGPLRTAALVIL